MPPGGALPNRPPKRQQGTDNRTGIPVSYTHLDVYKRQVIIHKENEQMVITRTVEMHAQLVGYDFKKKGLPTDKNLSLIHI